MKCSLMRCFSGSVMAAVLLSGCNGGPLDSNSLSQRVHHMAPSHAPIRTAQRGEQSVSSDRDPLPELGDSATLSDYLRYAALNNPGLEAEFQGFRAAIERLPQVRALPDPRFTYGYYIAETETRVGPTQHTLALSQTFPWFGKLQDKEDAAARNANAAYQRFEAARLALYFRVERAYNELYFLKRSIEITRSNIELLQQFERIARARYRVATASHPDVIRVQVELGKTEDQLRQLVDLRDPYIARLNAALNRPSDAAIAWPEAVSDRVSDDDVKKLLSLLRQRNPDLIALQEEIERERINAEVARKDGLPDLTLGVGYTIIGARDGVDVAENGDDAVLASFSVNIPLWRDKYEAGVREAVARRLAIANRRQEQTNMLTADLQDAMFEHRDARRRVELYRDTLIPKSTESLQASLAGFEQGASDFLDLVDTERTLLEFQLGLERALVDRATSYARIERLVGMRLSEIHLDESREENKP